MPRSSVIGCSFEKIIPRFGRMCSLLGKDQKEVLHTNMELNKHDDQSGADNSVSGSEQLFALLVTLQRWHICVYPCPPGQELQQCDCNPSHEFPSSLKCINLVKLLYDWLSIELPLQANSSKLPLMTFPLLCTLLLGWSLPPPHTAICWLYFFHFLRLVEHFESHSGPKINRFFLLFFLEAQWTLFHRHSFYHYCRQLKIMECCDQEKYSIKSMSTEARIEICIADWASVWRDSDDMCFAIIPLKFHTQSFCLLWLFGLQDP